MNNLINHDKSKEISTILSGQNRKLSIIEDDEKILNTKIKEEGDELDKLLAQVENIAESLGTDLSDLPEHKNPDVTNTNEDTFFLDEINWEELIDNYSRNENKNVSLDDLLPQESVNRINAKFDKPISRQKWEKPDFIICLTAALVGIITDIFCSEIDNPISKNLLEYGNKVHSSGSYYKNFRDFQEWINGNPVACKFEWLKKLSVIKVSHDNLPIDYRGPGYKGPYHRILSGGHDLLRFMSAIWQIKNGQFHGVRPRKSGGSIIDIIDISSKGNPYNPTPDLTTAIVNYLLHVASDAFTSTSLPVPGATLLREMSNDHDFRVFIVKSYTQGYNLRHILSQGLVPAVTGIVVWLYYMLRYKIPNLYKKWRKIPFKEENISGLKLTEMYTLSHGLVSAINVGKVVIVENPILLNVPQLLVFMKSALNLSLKTFKRYDYQARFERNKLYIDDGWNQLENLVNKPANLSLDCWPQQTVILS